MAVAVSRFGMVDEDRRSVHPFFAPKNSQEGFSARRQRQRTNSPVPREATFPKESINLSSHSTSQEWKNQLKAAASGEYLRPTRTTETFQIIETEPEKHVAVEPPIADSIILSETNGISTVLQVETFKPESSGYEKMPSASHKEEGMLILPQKMIGVCSGGKLVSPRSQSPAFKPTAKRKKGEIKSAEHIKQRIVKLRYGSTEKSHKILAQKIQEICSSIANRQSEIKEILKAPIAKPTHPFFLGGVGRIKDLTVACESATEQPVSCKVEKQHEMQRKEQHGSENAYSPKTALSNPKESGSLTDMSYKGRQSRSIRHAHAIEPVWPPKEMVHVRPLIHETAVSSAIKMEFPGLCGRRKLKYTKVHIADEEEILYPYSTLARAMCEENIKSKTTYEVNQPRRQVMTGSELQTVTGSLLACPMPTLQPVVIQQDSPANLHLTAKSSHGALLRLYNNIRSSSSAFDRFECETHDWIHKYSPQRAEEVLQSGREALVLRDWVKNLTVTSVGSGNSELFNGQSKSESSKRQDANSKRKKRKREEELDGFVISSDEEIVEMEELAWPEIREVDSNYTASGKRSVVRATQVSGNPAEGPRIANAVVISGPHGCGKTAAVYAVARELGFEVFEINSASRRSGKDILEKVGDMTKNHLVNQARAITGDEISKGVSNIAELLMTMGGSSSHGNVKAVSQPTAKVKKKRRGRPKIHAEPLDTNDVFEKKEKKQNQKQKQSLILLEEVDILFEEDRQFWSTTLDMILNSKRPVIMTCTDETLLPLHEMVLFAVLRFTPPPESLAIDYLILIASNEGHLLSRASVLGLLRSKHFDLRASITELNFSCQMAIGDTKGGLEWMLIQPSLTDNQTRTDENLRVVSVGTYQGDFNHGNCIQRNSELQCSVPKPISFLPEIWENWRVDDKCCGERRVTTPPSDRSEEKEECALQRLLTYERAVDAVSAADLHIFSENRRHDLKPLDISLQEVSEKFRSNFVEGSIIVQAEPIIDQSGVSTYLSFAVESYATQMQLEVIDRLSPPLDHESAHQLTAHAIPRLASKRKISRTEISMAFDSIAGSSRSSLADQRGSHISAFDGPISLVLEDLAPYVRSIVFYDLKLEERRIQLSTLLAQNGRNGKRMRTTRASHAALEGGSKADTRRERWFPVHNDFTLILQSGGDGWQELAWQRTLEQTKIDLDRDVFTSSARSSVESDDRVVAGEHSDT